MDAFYKNNFDIIRLFAALQVVLFHGIAHLQVEMHALDFLRMFPGVAIFFVISGFLISASYRRNPSLSSYYKNRLLRIYPGLWVCLFFSIFSAKFWGGIQFSGWSAFSWEIAQVSIAQFYNPDFLRGYGVGILNGSLWTIPVELQFYILLPIIFFLIRKFSPGYFLKVLAFMSLVAIYEIHRNNVGAHWDNVYYKLFSVSIFPHLFYFMMGVIVQTNFALVRRFIEGKFLRWLVIYSVWSLVADHFGLAVFQNHINVVSSLLLAPLVLSAAYTCPQFGAILHKRDFSYGIYIYHMVMFNILVECHWIGHYTYLVLGIGLTFMFAILSWYCVELPALKLKSYSILHWRSKTQLQE